MSALEDLFTPLHMVIVLVIVLLIFGPKRLPELGSGIGKSIRGFRDGISGTAAPNEGPEAPTVNQTVVAPADPTSQPPRRNQAV